jgi:hypothetical protein
MTPEIQNDLPQTSDPALASCGCSTNSMPLKAISLWNPWAEAMCLGIKLNETRSWPTMHRGDLVICSAKRSLDQDGLSVARDNNIPLGAMKFGFALCVVELYTCTPTGNPHFRLPLTELEAALGNYEPGRFAWQTRNLRTLKTPVPIIGRQGFWNLPAETVALINANLSNSY